jgi:hypothetical protein
MKRVKRPYMLSTETLYAHYETLQEAKTKYDESVKFYKDNIGKYGIEPRIIKIVFNHGYKSEKIIESITV